MCLRCLAGAAGFKSGQHGRTSGGKGQQETNVFRIMQIKLGGRRKNQHVRRATEDVATIRSNIGKVLRQPRHSRQRKPATFPRGRL